MQVILLSDVEKLGLRGDVVDVAPGYARNFLLPRRLAERATAAKVAELRRRDEQRARHEARSEEQARDIADLLRRTVLRFEVKSGPTGALFGSVTPSDIADEVWRTRKVRVDRRKIALAEPIKRIGRYAVPVEVFGEVRVDVKTLVVPEGGELPSEEELPEINTAEQPAPPAAVEGPAAAAAADLEEPAGAAAPDLEEPEPAGAAAPDLGEPAGAAASDLEEPAPADREEAPATAAAERPAYEAGDEVDPDPSAARDQVPDDAFDRAVDAATPDDESP